MINDGFVEILFKNSLRIFKKISGFVLFDFVSIRTSLDLRLFCNFITFEFLTATLFSDGIFDANLTLFVYNDVILGVPRPER